MALVNLLIVKHGKSGSRSKIIGTHVLNAESLLRKARSLASKYASYYLQDQRLADVYIYDPNKDRKGVDPSLVYWKPEELFQEEGYKGIIDVVKDAQGIEL
jgi:hypothetical protein